jgi:hypothetical protein
MSDEIHLKFEPRVIPPGFQKFRYNWPMVRRFLTLVFALALLSSAANAHFFAVRMQALFPTATRSGVKLTMRTEDGQPVNDAVLELSVKTPLSPDTRKITLKQTGPGEYTTDERFDPGSYIFTMADKTVPGEPLEKTFTGELPRPAGQDGQEWYWPPSGSQKNQEGDPNFDPTAVAGVAAPSSPESKPNVGLLLALLGAPVLLAVGAVIVVLIVARGKSKPQV